jgi:cellulose synthase/poly-beta-1,6-N-acetylglucosamine synthase-like glycosyltransferase
VEDLLRASIAGFNSAWLAINAYDYNALARNKVDQYIGGQEEPEDSFEDFVSAYMDFESPSQVDMLLPAYHEPDVLEYSVKSIDDQVFPYDTDVNLEVLLEPDDDETIHAAERISDEMGFVDVNIVPEEYPGESMKPRAVNYGFNVSDGEIVGIIDAEDSFDEGTLNEVTESLSREGNDYAQGVLDMVNEEDGWLNTLFRGEYGLWFREQLDSYDHASYPIPLGGTTNFFKREVLEEISEDRKEEIDGFWERYDIDERTYAFDNGLDEMPWPNQNVAEDFYLGMWAYKEDYEFDNLESVTEEESPTDISSWIKQRTRWQKGRMQTLGSFREHDIESNYKKAHIYAQSATPSLGPMTMAGSAAGIGSYASGVPEIGPVLMTAMGLNFAAAGTHLGLQTKGYADATDNEGTKKYAKAAMNALTLPAYWTLQWAADTRAIKQYALNDSNWEKTEHKAKHVDE